MGSSPIRNRCNAWRGPRLRVAAEASILVPSYWPIHLACPTGRSADRSWEGTGWSGMVWVRSAKWMLWVVKAVMARFYLKASAVQSAAPHHILPAGPRAPLTLCFPHVLAHHPLADRELGYKIVKAIVLTFAGEFLSRRRSFAANGSTLSAAFPIRL